MTDQHHDPDPDAPETRTLRDAQGMDRIVTMPRVYWGSYAFLLRETTRTTEDLLAIADEEAPKHGMSWHDYFPEGLACMHHFYLHERPDLTRSSYQTVGHLSDHAGPVSRMQIGAIQPPETPPEVPRQPPATAPEAPPEALPEADADTGD